MPGEPRGMWTSNRLCEAAVLQRKTDIHRQRLREVRPTIDTRDPRRPKSSNTNGARMEAERNAQIMHENGILLDKLSKILTREKSAQAGGAKLPSVSSSSSTGLHDIYRRKVREQIDRENQSLLRRLQYMKPSIDMVQFEQQWQASSQFASINRSQGNRNPVIASPPRRQSAQRRPQTVPTNAPSDRRPRSAAIGGRAQTPAHYSGGRAQTPAHYLQPLYSERELAAFPPAETAAEEALYAELEAEDADEPPQPALGDLGASAAN